jgi:hypothetical protein
VILINMLVGKNPWCEPIMSDEMYREYTMDDGKFFEKHFGFDGGVEKVLRGCLNRNVNKRWEIAQVCEAVEGLIGGPDSAVEYGAFRERVNSWASEDMDFSDVPVFTIDDVTPPTEGEVEKEMVLEEIVAVVHDEAAKGKRRKRRHRKHKAKHVDDVEAEGMMMGMAAAFSKMIAPLEEWDGEDEDAGAGLGLVGGFRMTFL